MSNVLISAELGLSLCYKSLICASGFALPRRLSTVITLVCIKTFHRGEVDGELIQTGQITGDTSFKSDFGI